VGGGQAQGHQLNSRGGYTQHAAGIRQVSGWQLQGQGAPVPPLLLLLLLLLLHGSRAKQLAHLRAVFSIWF
jgi:hypothetical protein